MLSVRGAAAAAGGESKMISNNSNFFNNCHIFQQLQDDFQQ